MPGYAEQNPTYAPSMRLITAITNATNAQVTTSFSHGYLSGLVVRILVPDVRFGMVQMDKKVVTITVTGDTTFTIDVDTTGYTAFTIPNPEEVFTNTFPEVVPVGEKSDILTQATRNIL